MIQFTVNIHHNFEHKATQLIAFLQTLDYITVSESQEQTEYILSDDQTKRLEEAKNSQKENNISLTQFKNNIKSSYGF